MDASTDFGSDLRSITFIDGAKSITLANSNSVVTAYKTNGTSKTLSSGTPQNIDGYAYIQCTAYFSTRFGREGYVKVTAIS